MIPACCAPTHMTPLKEWVHLMSPASRPTWIPQAVKCARRPTHMNLRMVYSTDRDTSTSSVKQGYSVMRAFTSGCQWLV